MQSKIGKAGTSEIFKGKFVSNEIRTRERLLTGVEASPNRSPSHTASHFFFQISYEFQICFPSPFHVVITRNHELEIKNLSVTYFKASASPSENKFIDLHSWHNFSSKVNSALL